MGISETSMECPDYWGVFDSGVNLYIFIYIVLGCMICGIEGLHRNFILYTVASRLEFSWGKTVVLHSHDDWGFISCLWYHTLIWPGPSCSSTYSICTGSGLHIGIVVTQSWDIAVCFHSMLLLLVGALMPSHLCSVCVHHLHALLADCKCWV